MASMEKLNDAALAFFEELESMELEEKQKEEFKIENDSAAEWALERIHDNTEEADRLLKVLEEKMNELMEMKTKIVDRRDGSNRYLKGLLEGYFRSGLKTKDTKTQKSYKLLSGTLVMYKPVQKYEVDRNKVIEWAKSNGRGEYVVTEEKLRLAELKKTLVYDEGTVYDPDTGVIVDGITAVVEPEKFEVKLG